MAESVPTILFACVHNAGRSQIAAALAEKLGGGRVRVLSAGSQPAESVNPVVVAAMAEEGIDLSRRYPTRLSDAAVAQADIVVTMGCGDSCPIYPGKRYLDWQVDDPAGRSLPEVRRIRDEIRTRVTGLLRDLGITPDGG